MTKSSLSAGLLLILIPMPGVKAQDLASQHFSRAEQLRKEMKADSAVVYYRLALAGFEKHNEKQRMLDTYNQLGVVLTRQDKYVDARNYLDKAQRLAAGMSAIDSLSLSTNYITLGVIEAAEKNTVASLRYHFKALGIRQRMLGEQHADVATSYGNLGNVYHRRNDYDSAILYHEKARIIREKINGENSLEVTQTYTHLGNAFKAKKNYASALVFYIKALDNKILQWGSDHKEVARFYNNVRDVYVLAGKEALADRYQQLAAKAIRE